MDNESKVKAPEVWPLIIFTNQFKQKDTIFVNINQENLELGLKKDNEEEWGVSIFKYIHFFLFPTKSKKSNL